MSDPEPDAESAIIFRRLDIDDDGLNLFDRLTDQLEKMDKANLGANDFQKTFERVADDKERLVYVRKPDGTAFTANIIAEVGSAAQGSWLASYPKKTPNLPFGDDHSPHRMVIAARCPTGAMQKMESMYKDFLVVLDGTRNQDQNVEDTNGDKFKVTEWTGREDGDKDKPANLMILRLKPTYEKSLTIFLAVLARKVGDTYSPDMLPDHKGSYFAHDKAKLVQRPYKDEDGFLIAPHELYSKLTEGTLFSAQISLSTYIIKDRNPRFMDSKIYHINVDKLTVLNPGYTAIPPAVGI
ncbi:hypothetical protein B0H17DRAFT_1208103 [Mycena rosella]|uniref:Uncharacterized protein n=1 Tax=Mycena rosella TaxID=1033263 RepID=A0AAD7G7E3_MYCRO|nr:hypothetical protein B0H17DRAFT_1208103 [Mycena rosella]